MNDERVLEILVDFANAIEAAAVSVKHKVSGIVGVKKEQAWDPAKIKWTDAQGSKGPYQKATEQEGNDFQALVEDLKQHDGKLRKGSYFFWLFDRAPTTTVGRKRK